MRCPLQPQMRHSELAVPLAVHFEKSLSLRELKPGWGLKQAPKDVEDKEALPLPENCCRW